MSWEEVRTGYSELRDMGAGLNSNGTRVKDNESMSCQNVYWKDNALWNMYGGSKYVADRVVDGSAVTGIYQYRKDNGTSYIVATCSNTIKYWNGSSWSDITGGLTITAGVKMSFAVLNDTLIGSNGTNPPWAWSGSGNAAALGGSPPYGKYVLNYRNHLVMLNCIVGATNYPQRAYRSGLSSPTTWDTSDDYWAFETNTASPITGGYASNARLIVLKEDIAGVVMGASAATFGVYPEAYPGAGCLSGYAVGSGTFPFGGNGALYPGRNGIYLVPEGGAPKLVTPKIGSHFRALDMAHMSSAVGVYYDDMKQYMLFAPSGLDASYPNDRGYLLNTDNGSPWPIADIKATCATAVYDNTDKQEYVLIGTSYGAIIKMVPPITGVQNGVYEFDGAPLANWWQSNWFDLNNSTEVKLLRELLIFIHAVGNNSLDIQVECRNAQRTKVYTGTFTPGDSTGEYDFAYGAPYARAGLQSVDGGARRAFRWIRIKISQSGNWGWKIERLGMRCMSLGQRRVAL